MKNNLKRMLAALLALTLSTLCAATAEPAGNVANASPYTVEGRTYPYLRQFTDEEKHPTKDEMTLYFVNGGDIPYVALSEYMTFFSGLLKEIGKGEITYEVIRMDDEAGSSYAVVRSDNDSTLIIDPEADKLLFDNYNSFTMTAGTKALVATLDLPEAEEIDPLVLIRSSADETQSQTQQNVAQEDPEESREDDTVETFVPESSEDPGPKVDGNNPRLVGLCRVRRRALETGFVGRRLNTGPCGP